MTRHDKQIAGILAVVAVVFFLLWQLGPKSLSDFGLSAFTTTLGIAFTVLLIDRLLRRREAARSLPQRLAAFEDVRILAQRRISFWHQAYMASVPHPLPTSVQELLNPATIHRIGSCLDMDSYANITPKRTWWQHAPESTQSFLDAAEKILQRYNAILEPRVFLSIQQMIRATPEPGLTLGLLQSDQEMGFPRVRVLGNYVLFMEDHFVALLELVDWLIEERVSLAKESGKELGPISTALSGKRLEGTPACMIAPEKLAAQLQALQDFRQKSAAKS